MYLNSQWNYVKTSIDFRRLGHFVLIFNLKIAVVLNDILQRKVAGNAAWNAFPPAILFTIGVQNTYKVILLQPETITN